MRKICLVIILLSNTVLSALTTLAQEPQQILLWPKGAPGSENQTAKEKMRITPEKDVVLSSIHKPSITPYLPSADKATGTAVIVIPGGGHNSVWISHEGYAPARWLAAHGIAAFVLKYRLAKDTNSTYTVDKDELADVQRAIRLVRSRAKEWHIDTAKVGAIGFSAGGELTGLAAMRYHGVNPSAADPIDRESDKPDFQGLIYPGNLNRLVVTPASPPAFIAGGYKDRADISEGIAQLYLKFKQAKVPAELHVYGNVGHGFGIRDSAMGAYAQWPAQFRIWLADMKFIK